MGKTFRYEIPRLPEEVFNMTVNFWNSGHGTIKNVNYNPNEQYNIIDVETSMKLGFWQGSYGERYRIIIYNYPTESKGTVADITINLKFGFGPQWNTPNKILTHWAQFVGTTPIDFSKQTWVYYLVILSIFLVPFLAFVIFVNSW